MAEPGAAKPAIQHKGSFRRREPGRKPRGGPAATPGRGWRPAAVPPVTLRHAGGTDVPPNHTASGKMVPPWCSGGAAQP